MEARAAFWVFGRLLAVRFGGVPCGEAVHRGRAARFFTPHTPVPAGHDTFPQSQVAACMGPLWDEMRIGRDALLGLGHHPVQDHGLFHMAATALRLSGRVNGVSLRHGEESRHLWSALWPGRDSAQVPIGHVTNGVHHPTWMSHRMYELLDAHLGAGWTERADDPALWDRVLSLHYTRLSH